MHPRNLSLGERAQSEVIGAVLVFALVLMVLTLVQVMAVPGANEQVEFKHSQAAQQDVEELGAAIGRVTTTGTGESVAIETGVYYPNRLFLLNPPPVAGSVRMSPADDPIGVLNAEAVDDETADYWNGSTQEFNTGLFRYQAGYNYYDAPPTATIENGLLYHEFEEAGGVERLVRDEGNIIQGRQLTLVSLNGTFSQTSAESVTLRTSPLSAPTQRVSIGQADDTQPVQIQLPTRLSEEQWEDLLGDEPHVTDIDVQPHPDADVTTGVLTITLEQGVTYDLRMSRVGIGDSLEPEEAYYVTALRGSNTTVTYGGSQEFIVQVRDRYNNPVSGVDVTFSDGSSEDGTFQNENDDGEVVVTSNENGQATALFRPVVNGSISVEANAGDLSDDNAVPNEPHETVTFRNLRVTPGDGGGPGAEINPNINPNESGNLVLVDVTPTDVQGNRIYAYNLTFRNTGSVSRSIDEARYSFGFSTRSSATTTEAPSAIRVSGAGISPTTLELGGLYEPVDSDTVAPDGDLTISVEPVDPDKSFDSFIVFSTKVDAEGERESGIYFVDESISDEALTANFTYTTDNLTVDFTDTSTDDGTITDWEWDFGDGATSTEQNPSHTYPASGTYLVTLNVTDDEDNTDVVSKEVTVTEDEGGTQASQVEYNEDGTAAQANSGATFSVSNTGATDVTVTDVQVSTTANADRLQELDPSPTGQWTTEVFVDAATDGYLEAGDQSGDSYTLGTSEPLTQAAVIDGGGGATITLYEFHDSNGSVKVNKQDVTVVLTFADGSSKAITFTA
jgi:PKD repeat protein